MSAGLFFITLAGCYLFTLTRRANDRRGPRTGPHRPANIHQAATKPSFRRF